MEGPMNVIAIALLFWCLVHSVGAQSQGIPDKTLAARTEYIPIETLTLSDQQFLTGDKHGKPVTIAGQLRLAQGTGQLPLVILVHGSGGVGTNNESWERYFNQMGISTFALDGFTGRGIVSAQADQSQLGRLNMILDVYRSLGLLAKHPGVDPKRIALMGFSRGGQIALYASLKRFQNLWNESGVDIAAYIPLYAQCYASYIDDTEASGPIRLFHGVSDDYNPIEPCRSYVERLRQANKDVRLTEYPDTWHVFDSPTFSTTPTVLPAAQTVRNCVIKEDRLGQVINATTNEPFNWQDACVERGVHVAANPVALKATQDAVRVLVKTVFKLD
jgi:dienelactone hydrolase